MSASETQVHPAGWYDDPSGQEQLRYWDGTVWTQHTSPRVAPTVARTKPLGPGFSRLSAWLGRLLRALVLLQVVSLVVEGWGWLTIRRFQQDPVGVGVDPLDLYDRLSMLSGVAYLLLMLPTVVVWPVWQYRLARSVADRLERSPGMHAGSWFIPFASFWYPLQNVRDLWQTLTSSDGKRDVPGWVGAWWACWLAGVVLGRVQLAMSSSATSVADYEHLALLSAVDALVGLGAAVFAVRLVQQLTRRARKDAE